MKIPKRGLKVKTVGIIGMGGEGAEGGSMEMEEGILGPEEGGLIMEDLGIMVGAVMSLEAVIGIRDSLMCRRLMSITKGSPK